MSGWQDSKGRRWRHRRPNGWPFDDKAPDGFTVSGYRRIDQKLRIRFNGGYWTCDAFSGRAGQTVYVNLECCWATACSAVLIDETRFNPDTCGDDARAFIEHCHGSSDNYARRQRLAYVDDWHPKKAK